ncbi:MAG: Cyclic beta-1,2-glucan synthase [Rhodanobacteraceae bacterium]|nr:MAG: Cyclic beta-1,2-glucan synthase [Rhodanobacteraceae bacterium]
MPDDAALPAGSVHLLGHGEYAAWVADDGAGCSRWKGLAVTRWRAGQHGGQGGCVYVRDLRDGTFWSAAARPCGSTVRAWRDEAMVRFARRDGAITTTLEIAVDPDDAVEVRGVGLRNDGPVERTLELTSYAELVLGPEQADRAHPAYSKMFVQTAIEDGVLLAWRRKKDPSEPDVWAAHALIVDGDEAGERECETDRARFIGRDGSLAAPAAMQAGHALSGTLGTVLDPIFSLRGCVRVQAGATRRAAFVTAVAASREAVFALIRKYRTPAACAEVFVRARAKAPRTLASLGIGADTARRFQRLAGALAGSDNTWRADDTTIAKGEGGAPVLWIKGISGDLPIVLARIDAIAQVELAKELVRAQRYWRAHQLPVDIVLVNAGSGAAGDALQIALDVAAAAAGQTEKSQGALFVLREDELDARLRNGLFTAACVVLDARDGSLAAQLAKRGNDIASSGIDFPTTKPSRARGGKPASMPKPADLDFWNGLGGFTRDGREYVTLLRDGASTPAPWSHVVANPDFGFLVTATGGGYCWAVNSQQNTITPWSNDAVCDPPGETFLLRDRDDGIEWSATASPHRAAGASYVARFGPGYARFDANVHGIETELTQCVAPADPVKVSRLRLRNRSGRTRRIALAQVVEWMLGSIGSDPRATTQVESDPARGAVFARNAWREEFAQATAFIACSAENAAIGSEAGPRSAAVATVELAPDASAELVFLLGEGADRAAAQALVDRYRRMDFDALLADARKTWDGVLQPLQVETPHRSIDLLVNRCLPYQVLACRVWARTAFYQASGAYGFRDQLQDVGALCIARPDLARQHILLSASRQFEEGDVQHWWLPPSGKGVRTRIVDDRLWLPYIAAHYIETTGDAAILDVQAPFVHGDALQPGQTDAFFAPAKSAQAASLFEHCARAIDASLATGVHGLPLMGTGDWNDGMNRVGIGGKGESVWMGWFLARVIGDFAPFAEDRRDPRAARWRDHVRALELALETKAWDGDWYRRAFYDDGTPLGTSADAECRIESMAQSWAVISGIGDPERAARAMRAVNEQLVRGNDGLAALFTQPFDQTPHDPGYIKGYPPGLRENGGQYTHGSVWSLIAFAMLGDGDKAGELLEIFDPIRKSDSPEKVARYKVEPYVECADVYSIAPHVGRGGWTWYSGSAGWLYRAIVEWVLGFRLRGDRLHLEPCIPHGWKGFALRYRRGNSTWRIELANPDRICRGLATIEVDGVTLRDSRAGIALIDDGADHHVRVIMHKEPNP